MCETAMCAFQENFGDLLFPSAPKPSIQRNSRPLSGFPGVQDCEVCQIEYISLVVLTRAQQTVRTVKWSPKIVRWGGGRNTNLERCMLNLTSYMIEFRICIRAIHAGASNHKRSRGSQSAQNRKKWSLFRLQQWAFGVTTSGRTSVMLARGFWNRIVCPVSHSD